jgi:hypothetical protein
MPMTSSCSSKPPSEPLRPSLIYKYPLPDKCGEITTIAGEVIHAAYQQGPGFCVWVRGVLGSDVKRQYCIVATGETTLFNNYVGTIHHNGYVWHVFVDDL